MVEIKGSAVRDALAAYRENLPDECAQVLDRLDPHTRALLTEVQPNEWLPLDAFVRYLQAQVDVTGVDAATLHVQRAEVVVERQLHGIYKIFARLSSPRALVERLSAIHSTYWRGLQVERSVTGKSEVVLRYAGFARGHRIMEPILVGFFRKVLAVNGAQGIEVQFTRHIGGPDPAELVVRWR